MMVALQPTTYEFSGLRKAVTTAGLTRRKHMFILFPQQMVMVP